MGSDPFYLCIKIFHSACQLKALQYGIKPLGNGAFKGINFDYRCFKVWKLSVDCAFFGTGDYNITHAYINIEWYTYIFYLSNNLRTDTVIFSLRRNLFKTFCLHFYIIVTSRCVDDFINQIFNIIY